MIRHAERFKRIGQGLLSESNHALKHDLEEMDEIIESIEKPVSETEDNIDMAAVTLKDTKFLTGLMSIVVKAIKEYDSGMDGKDVQEVARKFFIDLARDKSAINQTVRLALRQGKTVQRKLKRSL